MISRLVCSPWRTSPADKYRISASLIGNGSRTRPPVEVILASSAAGIRHSNVLDKQFPRAEADDRVAAAKLTALGRLAHGVGQCRRAGFLGDLSALPPGRSRHRLDDASAIR